ncbi:hypothetical protein JCM3770_006357 [Rhodotorula araucariae]
MLSGSRYDEDDLDYGEDELLPSCSPTVLADSAAADNRPRSSAPPESPKEPSDAAEGGTEQGDRVDRIVVDNSPNEVGGEEVELEEGELPFAFDDASEYNRSVVSPDGDVDEAGAVETEGRHASWASGGLAAPTRRRSLRDDAYNGQRRIRLSPYDRLGQDGLEDRWATQLALDARRRTWTTSDGSAFPAPSESPSSGRREPPFRPYPRVYNSAVDPHGRASSFADSNVWDRSRAQAVGQTTFAGGPASEQPYHQYARDRGGVQPAWVRQPPPNSHGPPPPRQYSTPMPAASLSSPPCTSSLPSQYRSRPQLPHAPPGYVGEPAHLARYRSRGFGSQRAPPPLPPFQREPPVPGGAHGGHAPRLYPPYRQAPSPPHQVPRAPAGVPVMLDPVSLAALQMGYHLMALSAAAQAQAQAQLHGAVMGAGGGAWAGARRAPDTLAIPMRQALPPPPPPRTEATEGTEPEPEAGAVASRATAESDREGEGEGGNRGGG